MCDREFWLKKPSGICTYDEKFIQKFETLLICTNCDKTHKFPVFKSYFQFHWVTANFTILNILLMWNGRIQQHRNGFPTKWTLKKMFLHNQFSLRNLKTPEGFPNPSSTFSTFSSFPDIYRKNVVLL